MEQLEDFQLVHICITAELFSWLVNRLELHIGAKGENWLWSVNRLELHIGAKGEKLVMQSVHFLFWHHYDL